MKKKLSVVIVSYNSEDVIYDCLESIFKFNDIGEELEVIIVDNNSKNSLVMFERISELYGSKINFISNVSNGGYGQGNNLGINIASAPYILIVNPDVKFCKPLFEENVSIFERDKKVGLIGLQQYENIELIKNASFIVKMPYVSYLLLHKVFSKLNIFTHRLFCFSGACFFVRKSTFIEAGRFDERIFLYGEETDLQFRILNRSNSNKLVYNKLSGYIHPCHERVMTLKSYLEGYKSFLLLGETQGISKARIKMIFVSYYKFLYLYFSFKDKKVSSFYKELVAVLKRQ